MAPNFAERIKPVEPERFHFALGIYCAAATMKGPYDNPQQFGINIDEGGGIVSRFSLTDIPETRGMLAVKKEFPDPDEFKSMSFRLLSFGEVMRDRKLRKMGLVRDGGAGETEVHDAVVNALAMVPFRKTGALDRKALFALAKIERARIEAEKEAAPADDRAH